MRRSLLAVAALLGAWGAREEDWPDEDLWYTVRIADAPVGSLHTTVSHDGGRYLSTEAMHVLVHRGDDLSEMQFQTDFIEYDEASKPASLPRAIETSYVQEFAKQQIKMLCRFREGEIELTSHNGEQTHVTVAPLETTEWAARLQSRRQFKQGCLAGAEAIKYRTVRPELGPKVVDVTSMRVGRESLLVDGVDTPVTVWDVAIAGVPVNMSEVYPDEGAHRCERLYQMRMQMPFGDLRATISNRAEAEAAAVHVEGRVLPELVYAMFVPLSKRIESVNEAYEVRVRVTLRDALQKLELPTAGYQAVAPEARAGADDAGPPRVIVTVNVEAPSKATAAELADAAFTSPSAMVDSSDTFLQKLAASVASPRGAKGKRRAGAAGVGAGAGGGGPSDLEVALALRDLVYEHIETKDLTTAFASASEVARTKAGDCTEHAVLLAALLRCRQIPARVCHGLVYVERYDEETERGGHAVAVTPDGHVHADGADIDESAVRAQFGWHMWTQALVNGHWMDLDATLHVPYNVGHILVGTSSMADVEGHYEHMGMAGLIGNLDMELLYQRYEPSS
ncbi:hypothetical protein KFE25_005651 [Diacronema lutheri]|uniref:Transglutaminase-like domain-containing protein n=1 Tax=Diacronema lutheri TaxID=2081491 RepID=A0A8J5XKN7_DIALT|nr:hypothetical protein KFE25_005651 [Diacronema lutheri]